MKVKLILLTFLTLINSILALNVSLNSNDINLDFQNSIKLSLENVKESTHAYEIEIYKVKKDKLGKDIKVESNTENDFLIIPNQILIMPNGSEEVIISYLGDKNIEKEENYRILVKEIDLNLNEEDPEVILRKIETSSIASFKFLTNYVKSFYINKKDWKHKINIEEKKLNQNNLTIVVKNTGKKRLINGGDHPRLKYLIKSKSGETFSFSSKILTLLANDIFEEILELPTDINIEDINIEYKF